jgi:hypothetical protein
MIRTVAIPRTVQRLGTVLPCCPADTGFFSAVFSDSCSYCTSADLAAQQALMANANNQGNTSGVPCCDPNDGFFTNLFSNSCNACNPISDAIGLPQIPSWAWLAAAGVAGVVLLGGRR